MNEIMRAKAKKYIIDNYGENWIRVQWNSDDVIDALAEFAEQQLKILNIPVVSNSVNCAMCGNELTDSEKEGGGNCCDLCWLSN